MFKFGVKKTTFRNFTIETQYMQHNRYVATPILLLSCKKKFLWIFRIPCMIVLNHNRDIHNHSITATVSIDKRHVGTLLIAPRNQYFLSCWLSAQRPDIIFDRGAITDAVMLWAKEQICQQNELETNTKIKPFPFSLQPIDVSKPIYKLNTKIPDESKIQIADFLLNDIVELANRNNRFFNGLHTRQTENKNHKRSAK